MGGFETYFAARQELFASEPLMAFLIQRVDLPSRAVEELSLQGGLGHRLVFEESGQRFAIEFVVETLATVRLADGTELPARLEREIASYLSRDRRAQWLNIPRPLLTDEQAAALQSLSFEQQWKISSIDGLSAPSQVIE